MRCCIVVLSLAMVVVPCALTLMQPEEVNAILSNKTARNYIGPDVEAMRAVAQAYSNRSLLDFQRALEKFTTGALRVLVALFALFWLLLACSRIVSDCLYVLVVCLCTRAAQSCRAMR